MISSPRSVSHKYSKKDKKFERETTFKWIRTLLFEMVNYIQINSPSFRLCALFSKIYFFFSITAFAFLPHCTPIYPSINLSNAITEIISTVFLLLYHDSGLNTIMIMFTIVISIFFIYAIIFLVSLVIFHKSAKIPKPILYFLSLGILFGPLYLNIVFLFISHFIGDITINGFHYIRSITAIIILLIIVFLFFPFYYSFLSPTLYFKPKTIIFYSSQSEKYFYLSLHFYTFFAVAFSRGIDTLYSIVLTYVSLIFLLFSIFCFIFEYDIVLMSEYYYNLPLLIDTFFLLLTTNTIRTANYMRLQKAKAIGIVPTFFLFLFFTLYFFLVLIFRFVINYYKKKYSEKLDNIEESTLESERQFFNLLRFGFEMNHPSCYDWSLFKLAIRTLHTKRIMICYAKISAFYFNKEDNLILVLRYFREQFWEEIFIKNFCFQIRSHIQSHNVSLDKSLRKELSKLHRKCVRCRSLMRYMWQNVICNDLSHIDRLALLLHSHTQSIEDSFAHILLNFSHNSFVAKSYAYFLSDVMQKQAESRYWKSVERTLRSGRRVVNERSQIISKLVMGRYLKDADYYLTDKMKDESTLDEIMEKLEDLIIPEKKSAEMTSLESISKTNESQQEKQQQQQQPQDAVQFEEDNKDDDERKRSQLELLINNVRLPSMKYIIVFIFIVFSIIVPFLIIIPFLISNKDASISETAFLSIIQSGSLAPAFIQTLIIGFMNVVSDLLAPLITNFEQINIPPEFWPNGWTNETTNEMIHVMSANKLRKRVNDFNSLISQVSLQKYYYDSIVAPFYADQFAYSVYDVTPGIEGNNVPILIKQMNMSMESILALYISLSYRITRFHGSNKWFYGQSQDFMNIEANSDVITSNLNEYTSIIINLALHDRRNHSNLLTSILIVTTVLIVVLSIITWIIVTYFIKKDSNKVYSILQFVPKNEISTVMHLLSPKEEEDANFDDKESGLRNNALRTLITPVGQYQNNWFSIVKVVVTLLIIALACLNLSIQVYLKNVLIDVPFNAAPLILHCGKLHTQVGTILHKILLYLSYYMMIEVNRTQLLIDIDVIINETLPNLDEFRYGSESNGFYKGINSINTFFADRFSQRLCEWPIDNFFSANIFFCENYETSLLYILNYIRILMESDPALEFYFYDMYPIIVWFFKKSYEQFVMPTEEYLMEMFSEQIVSYKKDSAETSIIVAIVLFFIGIILTIIIPRVAYPVYNCLRLLLFIDQKIVYESKPIMKLLSNDFSKFKSSKSSSASFTSNPSAAYFDKYYEFISSMEDSVLIASNEGIIVGANTSAVNLLSNKNKTFIFQDEKYVLNNIIESNSSNQSQSEKETTSHWKKFFTRKKKLNYEYIKINEDDNASIEGASIIGKSVTDVIQNKKFTRIFNMVQNQGFQPSFEISLSNDDSIHLTSIAVLHTGEVATSKDFTTNCIAFYCFVIYDQIEKSNLSKLLEEEAIKCRNIISSFFPEKLVDYIQSGNSDNIEITIQNATVVFVEMIQFSPLYFNTQTTVNSINDEKDLEKLIKSNILTKFINEVDRIIEKHPKMSRIKTMGGSYMAVGGIFDNQSISISSNQQQPQLTQRTARNKHPLNPPNNNTNNTPNGATLYSLRSSSSHAIDAVSFALDTIKAVQMLSMELNFPIRCRAGVHTCGPLSAGIIGDDLLSFEVVGSGISTALVMKETAKAMTVHITDAVCNLIFSGGFTIREAEEVIIGEKSIKSFVVTDYSNN